MGFRDRNEAGERLARRLAPWAARNPLILALPRGGVPVAAHVARALKAPLDVLIVRKIGAPDNPEYGIGAIAEGGGRWLNPDALAELGLSEGDLEGTIAKETRELDRRVSEFRGDRPLTSIQDRTVIVVDDGLATGVSALAAVETLRALGAKEIVLAVPVCAESSAKLLATRAHEVVCLERPDRFYAVSSWYNDFSQTSDQEVRKILEEAGSKVAGAATDHGARDEEVAIGSSQPGRPALPGHLTIPPRARGLVIFAHGSGSSRASPRNIQVARTLNTYGLGTLLFDLLSEEESANRDNVFDIPFLASRLVDAAKWAHGELGTALPFGFFGASTGGGAALWAAAELGPEISAVVSRGGRPDLAMPKLSLVTAPSLLIVGGDDGQVVDLNRQAVRNLHGGKIAIIPGATHLFEEEGALETVADLAAGWFLQSFARSSARTARAA